MEVEVTAARDDVAGTLDLDAPGGWRVAPGGAAVPALGSRRPREAGVHRHGTGSGGHGRHHGPRHVGDATWTSQRVVIRHEHIPVQLLQPAARLKAVALDLAIKGRRVGYIPGAGDRVAESLAEMGYEVTRLTGEDLPPRSSAAWAPW